jgi:hypothetical protein
MLNIGAQLKARSPGKQSSGEPHCALRSRRNRLHALRKEHREMLKAFAQKFGRPPEDLTPDETAQIRKAVVTLKAKWGF